MTRQTISLTSPNDEWLKSQLSSEEFSSKSEVINALVRRARKDQEYRDFVNAKLTAAQESVEKYGYVNKTPEEMLAHVKNEARKNGAL